MKYTSIRPGQIWFDTGGNRIQAHGGSILYDNDTFYWYGGNKEHTKIGSNVWHWGVRCYSSKDLYSWKDEGIIIPPEPDDKASPLHPESKMDRPHILFNKATRKYVCWLKFLGEGNMQTETILVADSLLGPYTIVRTNVKPLGMNAGDFDLTIAEDGKAYYYFERVHSELICADLTDDYTDVTGYYSTHFPQPSPPYVREAPAYFYRDHKHYLFTSGTTGYFPNPSEAACADTFHGPWTVLGNPHRYDRSLTSYGSQICSVFKHPHKKDLYIALADRWLPALVDLNDPDYANGAKYKKVAGIFEKIFSGNEPDFTVISDEEVPPEADTSIAEYVWLPVTFEDGVPYIDWRDEWRIEEYE